MLDQDDGSWREVFPKPIRDSARGGEGKALDIDGRTTRNVG